MAYCSLLPTVTHDLRDECVYYCTPDAGKWVCDPPAVYRPRHPEASIFYQTFEQHFDSYVRAYEERFEPRSGLLRRVVPESVEHFLACGRLQGGFARIRCPACKSEHLLAFSCRARGVCSSCQAKRAALFGEKLTSEILPPVPYRHWTFTIPKAIRGLFERERRLLGLLSRTAYDSIRKSFQTMFGRKDVRPGCVISIQSFGSFGANSHPHLHLLVSDGVFTRAGEFLELPSIDTAAVGEVFRRLLLRRLHAQERLSERFMHNLLGWVHPGFSVFAGDIIPPKTDNASKTPSQTTSTSGQTGWRSTIITLAVHPWYGENVAVLQSFGDRAVWVEREDGDRRIIPLSWTSLVPEVSSRLSDGRTIRIAPQAAFELSRWVSIRLHRKNGIEP